MQFLVYFIVLLISGASVLLGVEWMQAPMSPMPASPYELHAAKPPAPPVAQQAVIKPAEPAKAETRAEPAAPVTAAPAPAPVIAVVPSAPESPEPAPLVAPEPVPVVAAAPAPLCDIRACERAYRSFTAADCTYQPSEGPRRLCTRGTPPVAMSTPRTDARAQATCNIAACTDAYVSFNAADCTYQPADGPRRICER